ncbi:hypothetical protein Tc00.1047053506057.15 [Trypanosoma cruzi]|uniref:ATPase n=1 Tax=Trypanosoma cruzi (strain CL Brener) TaxID=353153 RepID=Q4D149_TRYCC|nr:uncharacterized protein Tc00.1047053506057.15 [Trypanosoma cruzi]EAN86251.1 hypothetical protein Tc00.1047053506057.15 [Trypanosoma cruzi]|eukprot:XP_808102.1 hypothetical protein Tc00.1047053506057.15 [Trypanosoma cruzi strain CL Brener]
MLCGLVGGYNSFFCFLFFCAGNMHTPPIFLCCMAHGIPAESIFFLCFHFFFFTPHPLFFAFGATTKEVIFFFSTLPSLIVCCCTLPARGAVCFPPNCSTRTPTDTLTTTALCASPAARMRRGRDERRAEGAVTCGRATRACGAAHTFLPSCFVFFAARAGRHPQRHTHSHTLPPCFFFFFFFFFFLLRSLSRWSDATPVMSACFSQSPHTRVTVLCGPHSRTNKRTEGSSNTQMTHEI